MTVTTKRVASRTVPGSATPARGSSLPPRAGARESRPPERVLGTAREAGNPAGTSSLLSAAVPAGPADPGVAVEATWGRCPHATPGTTPRTWVIELPAGLELLNANDRDGHWARRKRITETLRTAAGWLARQQQVPPLRRAHILAVYEPPDRRRRDPANLYPGIKACVDGLVDAGVLPDDDAGHLDGPDMRLGQVHRGGRLVLTITEVTAHE